MSANSKPKYNPYPLWSPRFWHGMRISDWCKLVWANRFRIHPLRMPMACAITGVSIGNSFFGGLQSMLHGKKIENAEPLPPVFILGHWRSGTTFLHELMCLDEQFDYPTTYQCFAPHHFLLTEWFMTRYCNFLLPKKRPMDNMKSGFNLPQEDEFALLVMGARTPYRRMAFPNHPPVDNEFLNMSDISDEDLQFWKDTLVKFVKLMTVRTGKSLILKSPPHTGRIGVLAELFPNAKFVHIVRDPMVVFPSTQKLWRSLDYIQALQLPKFKDLNEYIFYAFEQMYEGFERQKESVPANRLVELKYEELVANPIAAMERIYSELDLTGFENVRPKLESQQKEQREYKTNKYELEPEVEAEIRRRWSGFMDRYGYNDPPSDSSSSS